MFVHRVVFMRKMRSSYLHSFSTHQLQEVLKLFVAWTIRILIQLRMYAPGFRARKTWLRIVFQFLSLFFPHFLSSHSCLAAASSICSLCFSLFSNFFPHFFLIQFLYYYFSPSPTCEVTQENLNLIMTLHVDASTIFLRGLSFSSITPHKFFSRSTPFAFFFTDKNET